MCDLNKIAALITAASLAVLAAIVLFTAAAIAAGTFWGAFGNVVLMIAASVSIGLALGSINVAIASIGPCVQGGCKALAETIQNALIGLAIALTVLLAAVILGTFGASIPWAGAAVAIGLLVGAVAIGITLKVLGGTLRPLDMCLGSASTSAVATAGAVATVTALILAICVVVLAGEGLRLLKGPNG